MNAILNIIMYFIGLYPRYYLLKESGNSDPWLAFIPIVGDAMLLSVVGWNPWLYVWLCIISWIPIIGWIVNYMLTAIIFWNIAEHFGLGLIGKILTLFFFPLMQWYIALTNKQYHY